MCNKFFLENTSGLYEQAAVNRLMRYLHILVDPEIHALASQKSAQATISSLVYWRLSGITSVGVERLVAALAAAGR